MVPVPRSGLAVLRTEAAATWVLVNSYPFYYSSTGTAERGFGKRTNFLKLFPLRKFTRRGSRHRFDKPAVP
jgi:hypothetical protein